MKKRLTGILCLLLGVVFFACNKNDDDDHNDPLSKMDRTFIVQASYANNSEVAAGAMASTKGSDSAVRMFGAHMVDEHTKAQNELKALAGKWDVPAPDTPDSAHIVMMQAMATLQGHAFDTAYMKSQVMDHMVAIQLFQNQANNGENRKLRAYANKYLPHIMMHKKMADSILAKLQ